MQVSDVPPGVRGEGDRMERSMIGLHCVRIVQERFRSQLCLHLPSNVLVRSLVSPPNCPHVQQQIAGLSSFSPAEGSVVDNW